MRFRSALPYGILATFPLVGWLWLTFSRTTFFDPYVYADYFPRFAWAQRALATGHLPLFASGYAHGFPMYVDHFGLIHPLLLFVLKLFPLFFGYHTLIFFGFFLGGALAYRCGRAFGLRNLSALFFAFAYSYSGVQIYWGRELAWAGALIFFPLVLLLATFLAERAWWWMLLGGVLLGATFSIAFVEMAMYATFLAGAWCLWHDIRTGVRQSRLRTTKRFCGMMAIAALIGSPWLVPAFVFVRETNRATGSSLFVQTSGGGLGIGDVLQSIFPSLAFPFAPFPWLQLSTEGARLFVGILPFPFLFPAARKKNKRPYERFFWGVACVALLVLLPFLPFADLFYRIPFLHFFRFAWKWLFPFLFCITFLAAVGFDQMFFGEGETTSLRFWRWVRGLAIAGIVAPLVAWASLLLFRTKLLAVAYALFANRGFSGTLGRPVAYYHGVIDAAFNAVVHGISPFLPAMFGALASLGFLVALPWLLQRYTKTYVAIMTLTTLCIALFFSAVGTSSLVAQSFFSPPPAAAFLEKQEGFFRIAPFVPYLSDYATTYGVRLDDPLSSADIGKNLLQMNWAFWNGCD